MSDLTSYGEEVFAQLYADVIAENRRRSAMRDAEYKVRVLQTEFLNARDGEQPDILKGADILLWPAWVQPLGAHDAYPPNHVVRHKGKLWRNELGVSNPFEPDTTNAGWTDITDSIEEEPPAVVVADAWAEGVAYKVGDLVSFNEKVYACIQRHTSLPGWTPGAVPALWSVTT